MSRKRIRLNIKGTGGAVRFTDTSNVSVIQTTIEESMTTEQKEYLTLQRIYSSNNVTVTVDAISNTLTWANLTIATPPSGFPALDKYNFQIFINGLIVENDAVASVSQVGSDVVVTFNSGLNYDISSDDEYSIAGKFTS